jgi:WD40 repeat protein
MIDHSSRSKVTCHQELTVAVKWVYTWNETAVLDTSMDASGASDAVDLHSLTVPALRTLQECFPSNEGLDVDGFVRSLSKSKGVAEISETDSSSHQAWNSVFQKIDANSDGTVDWGEFTNYLLLEKQGAENLREREVKTEVALQDFEEPLENAGRYHRETIIAVMKVEKSHEYATCSADGGLRVWRDADLQFQRAARVGARVTHAVYLSRSRKIAISALDRSIRFFDECSLESSGAIIHLDSVVTRLGYHAGRAHETIYAGDDTGLLHSWRLSIADFWHVGTVESYVDMAESRLPPGVFYGADRLHDDWITHVEYVPDLTVTCTCSLDGTVCMVDVDRRHPAVKRGGKSGRILRTFRKHRKGVTALAYSPRAKCMATAGLARDILLWNPYSLGVLGVLSGHNGPVHHLALIETAIVSQLVSLSTDKVMKVWDLRTFSNVQTLVDNSQYRPENKITALFLDPHSSRYGHGPCLVTGTNRLTLWPIVRASGSGTVLGPLCAVVYNKTFDQVLTGGFDGTVCVWDARTGRCTFKFSDTHGPSKMTTMCLDGSERRLVTGAEDGGCFVWNFSNGQRLQQLGGCAHPRELSVVAHAPGTFLAAGWARRVFCYLDGAAASTIQEYSHCVPPIPQRGSSSTLRKSRIQYSANRQIRLSSAMRECQFMAVPIRPSSAKPISKSKPTASTCGHRDDITCLTPCPPSHVATGGADGLVCVWSLESGTCKWQAQHTTGETRKSPPEACTVVALASYPPLGALISCGTDGNLQIWNIQTGRRWGRLGRAGMEGVGAAMSMCDGKNIVTGDRAGHIRIWGTTWGGLGDGMKTSVDQKQQRRGRAQRDTVTDAQGLAWAQLWSDAGAWQAHHDEITGTALVTGRKRVISASLDGTASMWSLAGDHIGIFGNRTWDIDVPTTWRRVVTGLEETENVGEGRDEEDNSKDDRESKEAAVWYSADQAQNDTLESDEYALRKLRQRRGRRTGRRESHAPTWNLRVPHIVDVPDHLGEFIHRSLRAAAGKDKGSQVR